MSAELVVVGAGVMGLATAWRLARAGREVVVYERSRLGHGAGSSHGPTRIFRYAYDDPFYVSLAQATLPLWRELERESGEQLLDLTGGIDVGPAASIEPVERALRARGAACERIERAGDRFGGVASLDPAIASPDTGVLAAGAAVRALARLVSEAGGTVVTGVEAVVERNDPDGVVLDADGERVAARACVLAAGAWMPRALARIAIAPPLRVTREQVVYFPQPAEIPVVIHRTDAIALYALPQRFGAPGARVGEHQTGPPTDPDERSFAPDAAAVERVAARVRDLLPGLEPIPIEVETCLYTTTPDDHFVLDRAGSVVVASPCSGHGFKFAPLVGEICAALALGTPPPHDLRPLGLGRFP